MAAYTADAYRLPLIRPADDLFKRCLIASSVVGGLVLGVVIFTPVRDAAISHVAQLPKRLAKLIVEEPKPAAETLEPEVTAAPEEVVPEEPIPEPEPRPRERETPKVDPDAGKVGRERAQKQISQQLAGTTAALQSSLDDLSASLSTSTSEADRPKRRRRARNVRSGRSSSQVSSVETGLTNSSSADLSGSVVKGSKVAVGTLSSDSPSTAATASASSPTGDGAAPGVYRSNSSLLAVIQKYAAGIHYCYANELKHNENLRGKLVVSMTVAASGSVTNATVVENSLGSKRLEECALSQIRDWKFPPIAQGVTTFQAPFVFTPPK